MAFRIGRKVIGRGCVLALGIHALAICVCFSAGLEDAFAGGPKYVAGATYFNAAVMGQPVVWANGRLHYFVDQGSLGPLLNAQAVAMVDAAAAVWNAVPTAAVQLTDAGSLAEDVNGGNVVAGNGVLDAPNDVVPDATATPVAVIFDSDGAVIDALEGSGASDPTSCQLNGVLYWIDNMTTNANFAHGVIVVNGRCATSASLLQMMSYQLERAFGRILGLDYSQVNDDALKNSSETNGPLGWPIMEPANYECGETGGSCIPNPTQIRYDDVAAASRMYPVTASNLANFPGKQLTAANTVSIQGTISFRNAQGMQGVNVVARPLDANGNPLYQYTVTFVSGAYFTGNHGNEITGYVDTQGNRYDRFGSSNTSMQGYFDLSAIPLPPGVTTANYQVTFEAVNPQYANSESVGPYVLGSPAPSGTMTTITLTGLTAGGSKQLAIMVANSAGETTPIRIPVGPNPRPDMIMEPEFRLVMQPGSGASSGSDLRTAISPVRIPAALGTEADPEPLPPSGEWTSTLNKIGGGGWYSFPVQANRVFTVVTQALDETGTPSSVKAMPSIGVWDAFAAIGSAPAAFASAANGVATGETWLQVSSAAADTVRLGIQDARGDGRSDYAYHGWVLYADSVSPERLPAAGGAFVISGMGFRTGDTVFVGGANAQVTSILPNEITAIAPAAGAGISSSQDVTVNDLPGFNATAVIPGGISYDAVAGDALSIVAAPANQVPLNVPQPFTVKAVGSDGTPGGGVTVTYAIASGAASLGCGQTVCSVVTSGDGTATLQIAATSTAIAIVTASLINGASVQAHFYGGPAATISVLTPTLYLAAGATMQWPVQALVLNNGIPVAGQSVSWQSVSGIAAPGTASLTNSSGIASATLTVGPLAEGATATSNACVAGTTSCVGFGVFGSRPEFGSLIAVSGTDQSMASGATPVQVVLRALDMDGNAMAGATVNVTQALYAWAPQCSAHGRCVQAPLLVTQSSTLTSALDGFVSITPLTRSGVATKLLGLATTGNSASLMFSVEQHP
ncbi:Ig-like domain-containing protein [Acidicapsa dinghuensis]|uniref:Ig-like domain-containing protein n=1 Tax=Acidicapsa dinghuensis TaxID=2218256 RepID=A0ABW1EES2_9BACT|nr:Ig-like domain-containing protein [Acidicapsa dinghuensis]